ncbi:type II toxin-antitoxin system VapC family toxin [Arcticibacter eurypsychrophilus]|uniref:type II toxin-antitoxin system VapC family toxin n=1 Tax=Arcticibacter eurypsychrophilus TaxID=1434752 RepID=UPI00084DDFE5|nr:type II toxin-antitoxin system VapC family toxin [Arcticibacter eurypsychrophilus]
MENEIVCLDTSILIDFYRKKVKEKSVFFQLTKKYKIFAISVVTEYEILVGADQLQTEFWQEFLERVTVLPFDKIASHAAIAIAKNLKERNKLIQIPDIFIGATALSRNMKIATLNKKHFELILDLVLVN